MELLLLEVMIHIQETHITVFWALILKPTLCRATKLVKSVSLCSAKSCLECSEALKGLNRQTAVIGLPWISARALPDSSSSCCVRVRSKKSIMVKWNGMEELQK